MPSPLPTFHGKLIVFEGIDASGKTTQAKMLADSLRADARAVVLTKEPFLGLPMIAGILLSASKLPTHKDSLPSNASHSLAPQTEALLFAADRAEHVHKVLSPALNEGKLVVSDRSFYSSIAYQSAVDGMSEEWIRSINNFAPEPDVVLLLDLDPELAHSRVEGQARQFSHFEDVKKQVRIRENYLKLARENNWTIIDASLPEADVHSRVLAVLEAKGLLSPVQGKSTSRRT